MADTGASGQPNDGGAGGAGEGGSGEKNQVAYETYRKTVGEVKNLKSKLQEYEDREREREQASLVEKGKIQEALTAAQAEAKDLKTKLGSATKTFAKTIFQREAKSVALQMGADPAAVDDLIAANDWSTVEIGDDLKINQDQLKEAITKFQKDKPFYFKKAANPPRDVHINGGAPGSSGGKPIDQMTREELEAAIRKAP